MSLRTVYVLTEDERFAALIKSLLWEAGIHAEAAKSLPRGEVLAVVDLDTAQIPEGDCCVLRVSRNLMVSCDLYRPFSTEEFIALVKERFGGVPYPIIEKKEESAVAMPSKKLTLEEGCAVYGKDKIALSPAEYRLLALLLSQKGQAVSVRACAEAIGGEGENNAPAVYINHLRKKLDYAFHKRMIITIRQKGYAFLDEDRETN